jgi:hypothetical protein
MSNIKASEEMSPHLYGNEAYKEYRKTEKKGKQRQRKNKVQGKIIKWYSILSGQ